MPTMAAITIKKNDGSTDVTYSVVTASGGDKSPAVWRDNGFGGTPGQRPELRISAAPNGDNSGRKLTGSFTYPALYTDSSTSLTKVLTRANFQFTAFMPSDMPDASAEEFGAQIGNLIAAALVEEQLTLGYAAA